MVLELTLRPDSVTNLERFLNTTRYKADMIKELFAFLSVSKHGFLFALCRKGIF